MPASIPQAWNAKKAERFIKKLAETGHVGMASKLSGVARSTAYVHREKDPDFKEAWNNAMQEAAINVLEAEAVRRGVHGIEKNIYYQGNVVDVVKEYSDTLLIFLLKGAMREKYQDSFKVGGDKDNPLRVETTPENRQAEIAALAAELGYVNGRNGKGS